MSSFFVFGNEKRENQKLDVVGSSVSSHFWQSSLTDWFVFQAVDDFGVDDHKPRIDEPKKEGPKTDADILNPIQIPKKIGFYRDVFPILRRPTELAWTNPDAFGGHGPEGPGIHLSTLFYPQPWDTRKPFLPPLPPPWSICSHHFQLISPPIHGSRNFQIPLKMEIKSENKYSSD